MKVRSEIVEHKMSDLQIELACGYLCDHAPTKEHFDAPIPNFLIKNNTNQLKRDMALDHQIHGIFSDLCRSSRDGHDERFGTAMLLPIINEGKKRRLMTMDGPQAATTRKIHQPNHIPNGRVLQNEPATQNAKPRTPNLCWHLVLHMILHMNLPHALNWR